jgi:hypothetical protein
MWRWPIAGSPSREVRHQHESDAAFEDVAKLEGVGGITNAIRVVTAPRMG